MMRAISTIERLPRIWLRNATAADPVHLPLTLKNAQFLRSAAGAYARRLQISRYTAVERQLLGIPSRILIRLQYLYPECFCQVGNRWRVERIESTEHPPPRKSNGVAIAL